VIAFFFYCHGAAIAVRLHTSLRRIDGVRGDRLAAIAGGTVRGVLYGVLRTNLMQALLADFSFLLAGVPGAGLLALLCFFLTLRMCCRFDYRTLSAIDQAPRCTGDRVKRPWPVTKLGNESGPQRGVHAPKMT